MIKGVRWLAFAGLVLTGYGAVHYGWFGLITDQARIAGYLEQHGLQGLLAVTLGGAFYTGLGAPRQLLALAMGFAVGGLQGTILSTLATALGTTGCFFTARLLLRAPLLNRFQRRLNRFDALFREQTLLKILMIRLLPVGSNLATNLIAGCSGIRFLPFITGSVIGYVAANGDLRPGRCRYRSNRRNPAAGQCRSFCRGISDWGIPLPQSTQPVSGPVRV